MKFNLINFLLTAGILFLSLTGQTQDNSLTGQVISLGHPLPYATVVLNSTSYVTTTDTLGYYHFDNLPPGQYILETSFVGLQTRTVTINLAEGQHQDLDVRMDSSISLEEIVVTGTMKPTYVSDSPIKIDVITARQLDTYMPSAASSVVESIQMINGVQEVISCGVCFTNSISINGLEGPYTAILMDGTPMYGNLASVYGLNGIPNMIIDRIEVIKGPSSTLYGSEAVAGVINIITKDPSNQPLMSVDVMGTSHRESFGNLAFAPKFGRSSGYIGLNYAYINDFDDQNADGFGDNINLDRLSLFSKWNIHRKSKKQFSLAAKYFYEDRRNGVEAYLTDRAYKELRGSQHIYGESIYTRRLEIFGTYELNTSPYFKIDFSFSDHDQDSYYGSEDYQARQKIGFVNMVYNLHRGNHDVIAGATVRLNAYDDNTVATETVGANGVLINQADNQFIPGVFFQDEITLGQRWTLLSGARLDHFTSHGIIFSPRLNLKYKPGTWTTLRTNVGTGFRTVNLFTEDHAFVTGQRTVVLTEELLPERSVNVSFNLNHVFSLGPGSGTIDLESYFTHFYNKIIPNYDIPGQIVYANSSGYARSAGIGMNITYNFDIPLSFNLSYNRQRVIAKRLEPNGAEVSDKVQFAPAWSGLASVNYKLPLSGMTLAYTSSFTGPMRLPEVYDLDENGVPLAVSRSTLSEAFGIHNIQITLPTKNRVAFYAGIQNLFDFRQATSPLAGYNDPNAPAGFSRHFDTSYAFAPTHGREFYLGVKWEMKSRQTSQ